MCSIAMATIIKAKQHHLTKPIMTFHYLK